MRATTTLIFLFLLFGNLSALFAHDYQSVYSNRVAMYHVSGELRAMKMDSVQMQENDSVFFPVKRMNHNDNGCYNLGASWLGEKIVISEDWNLFINQEDTIRIKTSAELNESWICFASEDYSIEATVSKLESQSFLGLEDLVKTITFQSFDENNQPIDLWEDKTLAISKNYGLINGFDFDWFVDEYDSYRNEPYTLAGLSNPKVGAQNLTWMEVWDFQPGDEVHVRSTSYNYYDDYSSRGAQDKSIVKYLTRTDETNKVTYKKQVQSASYVLDEHDKFSLRNVKNYEATQVVVPDDYFDALPGIPYGEGIVYVNAMYDPNWKYLAGSGGEFQYEEENCWHEIIICYDCDAHYRRGLGGPYYDDCGSVMSHSESKLVYYKKGNVEWGSPLKIETGIAEIQTKSSVVYHPDGESLQIHTETLSLPLRLELLDLTGRTILQSEVTGASQTISLSHLPKGVYLYRLMEKGKMVDKGKIIR
ncbi:MAG: T9SS type A sorting domain-containing protein [Dysgonamonadaceae bacterium]|jgi:hypothetical protein|nr:T9SS type A sorting domain-containing protein [Dysgonamonadaceae bacterium]